MIKTAHVQALTGSKNGRAALEFDMPGAGDVGVASGLILTPTPSVWSMFAWRIEAVESCQNYQLRSAIYKGFIVFSDIAGTPDARFGTGVGDPGYSANVSEVLAGPAYSLNTPQATLAQQGNVSNRPIEVLSTGAVTVYYTNLSGNPAYARAVLTIDEEVTLPFAPLLVP